MLLSWPLAQLLTLRLACRVSKSGDICSSRLSLTMAPAANCPIPLSVTAFDSGSDLCMLQMRLAPAQAVLSACRTLRSQLDEIPAGSTHGLVPRLGMDSDSNVLDLE